MPGEVPLVYIIAGEASGDVLGGRVIEALKEETGGEIAFRGIGGPRMAETGLKSRVPMSDLSVMGLVEVLPHIRTLSRHIRETVADIEATRPDILVTIDSPGFCHRVSQALRKTATGRELKIVHYVAPTVWAWKPKRAEKIARFLDRLLVILPFEPPYFEKHGLDTVFVGHSAVEPPAAGPAEIRDFQRDVGGRPVMLILPGSRKGEVGRLLPLFLGAYDRIKERHADLSGVIPAVEAVEDVIRAQIGDRDIAIVSHEMKPLAFGAGDVALAAGGTAILELVLAGVPTVAAYRVSPLSAFLVRRLLTITRYSLPNIVLDRDVVPEIYQDGLTAGRLAEEVTLLLDNHAAAEAQRTAGRELRRVLGGDDPLTPSQKAARAVLELLEKKPSPA
ncbi:MAG: lipid-A-disaccharide synthase [Alphaproteobacteria bacterium]|nr:lipid-A-disaccharide synthase [Alphaproteobacteria bacterium]